MKTRFALLASILLALGVATPQAFAVPWNSFDFKGTEWDAVTFGSKSNGYAGYVFRIGPTNLDMTTDLELLENGFRYGGYLGGLGGAQFLFTQARALKKKDRIRSDYKLGIAAQYLVEEMMRQGWIGLKFPNGRDIRWALKQAGYTGNPDLVKGFVWYNKGKRLTLDSSMGRKDCAARFPIVFGNFQSMGAGTNAWNWNPTNKTSGAVFGLIQAFLFSPEPVANESRALFKNDVLNPYIGRLITPDGSLALTLKRGKAPKAGVTRLSSQVAGKLRVTKGRLPKGVRLVKGRFVGKPTKPGRYKFAVSGSFRMVRTISGADSPEGRPGFQTVNVIIRVVK